MLILIYSKRLLLTLRYSAVNAPQRNWLQSPRLYDKLIIYFSNIFFSSKREFQRFLKKNVSSYVLLKLLEFSQRLLSQRSHPSKEQWPPTPFHPRIFHTLLVFFFIFFFVLSLFFAKHFPLSLSQLLSTSERENSSPTTFHTCSKNISRSQQADLQVKCHKREVEKRMFLVSFFPGRLSLGLSRYTEIGISRLFIKSSLPFESTLSHSFALYSYPVYCFIFIVSHLDWICFIFTVEFAICRWW